MFVFPAAIASLVTAEAVRYFTFGAVGYKFMSSILAKYFGETATIFVAITKYAKLSNLPGKRIDKYLLIPTCLD